MVATLLHAGLNSSMFGLVLLTRLMMGCSVSDIADLRARGPVGAHCYKRTTDQDNVTMRSWSRAENDGRHGRKAR